MNPSNTFSNIITILNDSVEKKHISNWSEEDHEGEALWQGNPQLVNKLTSKYQMLPRWLQDPAIIIDDFTAHT